MFNLNSPFWHFCEWFYSKPEPPPRKRTKPMEVLCVGFPRSGTESMQNALLMLGYDYTYHGWDIIFEENHHMRRWVRLARKKWFGDDDGDCHISREEFDAIMGHSVAVTDAPASCFAAEMIAAYPEAKVVLNYRDLESWHRSAVKNLCGGVNDNFFLYLLTWFNPELWYMWHVYERFLWHRLFRCTDNTFHSGIVKNGKWIYREHCAMIRGLVPKERLLEWQIHDGWEPLCEFLGKEVPDAKFPRTNDAAGFEDRVQRELKVRATGAFINMGITAGVLVGLGAGLWSWLR